MSSMSLRTPGTPISFTSRPSSHSRHHSFPISTPIIEQDEDEEWKVALRQTVLDNLKPILLDRKITYEQALEQLSASSPSASSATAKSSSTVPHHRSTTPAAAIHSQKQRLREKYDEDVRGLKRLAELQYEEEVKKIMQERERMMARRRAKSREVDRSTISEGDESVHATSTSSSHQHQEIAEMDPDDDTDVVITTGIQHEDDLGEIRGRRDWQAIYEEQQVIMNEIRRRRERQREAELRSTSSAYLNRNEETDAWGDSPSAGPSRSPPKGDLYSSFSGWSASKEGGSSSRSSSNGSASASASTGASSSSSSVSVSSPISSVGSIPKTAAIPVPSSSSAASDGNLSSSVSSSYSSSLSKSYGGYMGRTRARTLSQSNPDCHSPSSSSSSSPTTRYPLGSSEATSSSAISSSSQLARPASRSASAQVFGAPTAPSTPTPAQREVFEKQQEQFRLREQEIKQRMAERKKNDKLNWEESVKLAPLDEDSQSPGPTMPASAMANNPNVNGLYSRPRAASTVGTSFVPGSSLKYVTNTASAGRSASHFNQTYNPSAQDVSESVHQQPRSSTSHGHRRSSSNTYSSTAATTSGQASSQTVTYSPMRYPATTPVSASAVGTEFTHATNIQAPQPRPHLKSLFASTSSSSASASLSNSRPNSVKPIPMSSASASSRPNSAKPPPQQQQQQQLSGSSHSVSSYSRTRPTSIPPPITTTSTSTTPAPLSSAPSYGYSSPYYTPSSKPIAILSAASTSSHSRSRSTSTPVPANTHYATHGSGPSPNSGPYTSMGPPRTPGPGSNYPHQQQQQPRPYYVQPGPNSSNPRSPLISIPKSSSSTPAPAPAPPSASTTPAPHGHGTYSVPASFIPTPDQVIQIREAHAYQWSKIPSYVTLKWADFPWPVLLADSGRGRSNPPNAGEGVSGVAGLGGRPKDAKDIEFEGVKAYLEWIVLSEEDENENGEVECAGGVGQVIEEDDSDEEEEGDEHESDDEIVGFGNHRRAVSRSGGGGGRQRHRTVSSPVSSASRPYQQQRHPSKSRVPRSTNHYNQYSHNNLNHQPRSYRTRKNAAEKIREEIRKWHPEKFEMKYLRRVQDERERLRVREGAERVAKWLSEMLSTTR